MDNKRWAGSLVAAVVACLGLAAVGHGADRPSTGSAVASSAKPCAPSGNDVRDDDPSTQCLHRFDLTSASTLPYYASYPLTGSATPTGAVIVIHGTGRTADHYFAMTSRAAEQEGPAAEVIAPRFQTDEDNPERSDAYWTNGDKTSWKDGGNAVSPKDITSFDAIDAILKTLADKKKFPNLKHVTLLGHSAGGQFVQRYAAAGTAPGTLNGLDVHFVVANPSSYLYLDDKRPDKVSHCDDVNDYKYGLDHRFGYIAKLSVDQIRTQYTSRTVTYLLGEKDTVDNGDMDKDCPAMAQGPNRFERGENFFAALRKAYPKAPHDLVTVPGVAHENEKMINSKQGKAAIFRGW